MKALSIVAMNKVKMKIGISTALYQNICGDEIAFEKLARIGYSSLDYNLSGGYKRPGGMFSEHSAVWEAYFKKAADSAKRNGLEVCHTHGVYPPDFIKAGFIGSAEIEQFRKEIIATAVLGGKYIVIHPWISSVEASETGREKERTVNFEMYGKLIPILEEYGVCLAIENLFRRRDVTGGCPADCIAATDMIEYISMMQSGCFAACLDTGHMNMMGLSPAVAAVKLGGLLKILHVHDNFGTEDYHLAPGIGTVDWKAFICALRQIGYDGVFSLEVNGACGRISQNLVFNYAGFAFKSAKAVINL